MAAGGKNPIHARLALLSDTHKATRKKTNVSANNVVNNTKKGLEKHQQQEKTPKAKSRYRPLWIEKRPLFFLGKLEKAWNRTKLAKVGFVDETLTELQDIRASRVPQSTKIKLQRNAGQSNGSVCEGGEDGERRLQNGVARRFVNLLAALLCRSSPEGRRPLYARNSLSFFPTDLRAPQTSASTPRLRKKSTLHPKLTKANEVLDEHENNI